MKFTTPIVFALVTTLISPVIAAPIDKRAVVYVTLTETADSAPATTQAGAGLFRLAQDDTTAAAATTAAAVTTAAAAVAAATTAAAATTSSSGGFLSSLGSLFGGLFGSGSSTTSAAPAVAATTQAAATQAATTAAAATTSSSGGIADSIENFLNGLFKQSSSSSTPTYSTAGSASGIGSIATSILGSGSSSTTSTSSSSSTGGSSGGNTEVEKYSEKARGITYSPYTKGGSCKSASEVADDMDLLSNYGIIRLYGVDCSGVENVLAAINSNQKVFLGVYNVDDYNLNQDLTTMKTAVEGHSRGWSAVHTVAIGNELVNAGTCTPAQIVSGVKYARSWFKQNASSYSGYIVSVDTLVAVVSNPTLCDVSDYLAVNSHPFWDGGVDPSDSGPWLQQQISNLEGACGSSKTIFITETGWPTQGSTFGKCVPSVSNQLAAIKSIANTLADQVLMFTTYNDYWKDGGSYGVEKYWGIYGDPEV